MGFEDRSRRLRIVSLCATALAFWYGAAAAKADLPKGLYQTKCSGASMHAYPDGMPYLQANCTNFYGQAQTTTLNAPESCPTVDLPSGKTYQIYDVNGFLACNFKPAHQDQSGRDWVDWVGKTTWTDSAKHLRKTFWMVLQPNNQTPLTPYPEITYLPGDTVNLIAGGCAQSGGSGNTWKRYVDPNGDSSGWPGGEYFGVAVLEGTDAPKFNPPQPPPAIINIVGQDFLAYAIPLAHLPYSLTLGYVDDGYPNSTNGYGDNGYYSHDEGNNGQCTSSLSNSLADGPSWVIFEVDHPLKSTPPPFSTGSKPFDIVFNQLEANGLPMNPEWYWNLHPPSDLSSALTDPYLAEETLHAPDFNVRCGPAFSTRGTSTGGTIVADLFLGPFSSGLFDGEDDSTQIDWSKIANSCTSQPAAVDQYYAFDNASSAFLSNVPNICEAHPIKGHFNMQPVTYSGSLHFSDWSGAFPEDNDINMSLVPASGTNTGLLWGQTVGSRQQGATSGSETSPFGGLLIEFDSNETVWPYFANRPNGTFWHAFATAAMASGPTNSVYAAEQPPISDFQQGVDAANELMVAASSAADAESVTDLGTNAVVTGLMGIDGVHSGGIAELHPVFALAIHQKGLDETTADGKSEHWSFFIRNQGDEGNCSDHTHSLEPYTPGARDYYIELPWPSDPGKPAYDHVSTASGGYTISATPWANGSSLEPLRSTPGVATYLHFLAPPYALPAEVPFFGYDGEITLQYTAVGRADRPAHSKMASIQKGSDPKNDGRKSKATDGKEQKESNDAEDFPWREIVAASNDVAVGIHLRKYFIRSQASKVGKNALLAVTQRSKVDIVGHRALPRSARLPHRTHELVNSAAERRIDEISRQEGSPRRNFQAVDAQHVFFLGTDGDLRYKEGPFEASDARGPDSSKLVDHEVTTFAAVSTREVLKLGHNHALYIETSPFDIASDASCVDGYVWREARANDRVCVTPATREEVAADNATGPSHVLKLSFLKPDTCVSGYVWRQATDTDHVCVQPDVRSETMEDNKLGRSRLSTASKKQFFGWPVVKFAATSYGDVMVLDAAGKLMAFRPPFDSTSKRVVIATKVRAFQAIDQNHTLVLTTDDELRSYPPAAGGAAPIFSNAWDFQEASDGSIFVIDGGDILWSQKPRKLLETGVRQVQAITASTIFFLKDDGSLSVRQTVDRGSGQSDISLATDITDFQAIDAQTVFVLDRDGKLWLLNLSTNLQSSTKSIVADDVR